MPADPPYLLREFVAVRAGYRCEYCLLHEEDAYSPHQIDHVVSRKHGGSTSIDNLAFCCMRCNVWKGSDLGSFSKVSGHLVRLYNPRKDRWRDHFRLQGALIEPLTPRGEVTVRLLKLNAEKRLVERKLLISLARYPSWQ